jgi:hypothetical protein
MRELADEAHIDQLMRTRPTVDMIRIGEAWNR